MHLLCLSSAYAPFLCPFPSPLVIYNLGRVHHISGNTVGEMTILKLPRLHNTFTHAYYKTRLSISLLLLLLLMSMWRRVVGSYS